MRPQVYLTSSRRIGFFCALCLLFALAACTREGSLTFRLEPSEGEASLLVEYECFLLGGEEQEPITYLIDFDDGETSTEPEGDHIFTANGTYDVTCTATDALGESEHASEEVSVADEPPEPEPEP